jgi:hypothetical protein
MAAQGRRPARSETGQHSALLPGQGRTVRRDEATTEAPDDVGHLELERGSHRST